MLLDHFGKVKPAGMSRSTRIFVENREREQKHVCFPQDATADLLPRDPRVFPSVARLAIAK